MGLLGRIILLLLAVGLFCPASAASAYPIAADTIYFRNNSALVLRDYRTNGDVLSRIDTALAARPLLSSDTIQIVGYGSSVGSEAYNQRLALQRARAVRTYLRWQYPYLRNRALMTRGAGFGSAASPALQRYATVLMPRDVDAAPSVEPPVDSCKVEPISELPLQEFGQRPVSSFVPMEETDRSRPSAGPRFALKTNLLYWAALTPNIEAEYYFARRWSLNLEYQGAWWSNPQNHQYFRIMAASPEIRFWVAHREHFRGHFFGLYGGVGSYEFMRKAQSGVQGEFYISGGISYGYSFRVGRRLRMEASIGIGYLLTEYREYHWDAGCYVYDRTKRQTFIGPTKAKLTLTYPLWWFGPKGKGGLR